jgi:hypothetical protein
VNTPYSARELGVSFLRYSSAHRHDRTFAGSPVNAQICQFGAGAGRHSGGLVGDHIGGYRTPVLALSLS